MYLTSHVCHIHYRYCICRCIDPNFTDLMIFFTTSTWKEPPHSYVLFFTVCNSAVVTSGKGDAVVIGQMWESDEKATTGPAMSMRYRGNAGKDQRKLKGLYVLCDSVLF